MAFRPINFDEGALVDLPMSNGGSSASYTKGQALVISSGYYATASAGGNVDITHVCMENGTITTNGTTLKAIRTPGVVFEADTDAAWSIVDQGTYADLASATAIDPDASTDDIFYIEKGVGTAETDTKVIGWFVHGAPNS